MQLTAIDHNSCEKKTFLVKFVEAYEDYVKAQQELFFVLYPERLNHQLNV